MTVAEAVELWLKTWEDQSNLKEAQLRINRFLKRADFATESAYYALIYDLR